MTFPEGTAPTASDDEKRLLSKICSLLAAGTATGSVNPIYTGAAPPAAPAFPNQGAWFYPNPATGGPNQSWSITDQAWF